MLAPAPWDQIDQALASRSMRLRFEPELETRYEVDTYKEHQKAFIQASNWIAPAIAIMMYCDHFLIPDVWSVAIMLRLLAMAPYTLLAHLFRNLMGTTRVLESVAVIGVLTTGLVHLAKIGLTVTLFFIGSGLSARVVRSVGPRPYVLGTVLWVVISAVSLYVILHTA